MHPLGWPGYPYREGSLEHRLPTKVYRGWKGPAGKNVDGGGFLNPAMAGNRTRSVIMLDHLAKTVFKKIEKIQIIDALGATGIRTRRWLNETSDEVARRLYVTTCDQNETAISWARSNLELDDRKDQVNLIQGDTRRILLSQGWHWIDLDPYGSPIPYLDLAMQATARRAVMSISATDTAALSGSSPNPLKRRYGARVHMDGLKHDTGLRILLATSAMAAARHDRVIRPLFTIWDSHHLRVTVMVERSKGSANLIQDSIGWRIHSPSEEDVEMSIGCGLLPEHDRGSRPMHVMLPLSAHPPPSSMASGPLWTGDMGSIDVMSSLTEAAAEKICSSLDSELDFPESKRCKDAVKKISSEGNAIHGSHLIVTDMLPGFLKRGNPPSPQKIARSLRDMGYSAEVSRYAEPSLRTDAPWGSVIQAYDKTG